MSTLLLLACSIGSTDSDEWETVAAASMSAVWDVENLAWDLAVDDGQLLCTAQFGGSLWAWDPSSDSLEERGHDLGQPLGVLVHEGTTYLTGTDNSIAGWVGVHDGGRNVTVLAEAGDAGLPMRRPADIVFLDGQLLVADPVAEVVWTIDPEGDSATVYESGIAALSVGVFEGDLVIGTEEGVTRNGDVLDDQEAYALNGATGTLLASGLDGVREVGGGVVGEGPARPGSIEVLGDLVYVADQAEGSVFTLESP